jgi:hypothetical protein
MSGSVRKSSKSGTVQSCNSCEWETVVYTMELKFGILWCSKYDRPVEMGFRCKECVADAKGDDNGRE